jgi:hypothetical protein
VIGLPKRPTAGEVESALSTLKSPTYSPSTTADVLGRELLHLRECIERCKSLQRVNEEAAKEWEGLRRSDPSSASVRSRAIVYREVADELAKALDGF